MTDETAITGEIVPHGAPVGRPSTYRDEIAEEICERLADGQSLVTICRDDHMPSLRTAMRWAADNPDFGTKYARAREAQAEYMDHLILEAATLTHAVNAPGQRVKIDAYKWRAAKLAPKAFGDKIEHKHTGAVATVKAPDLPDDQNEAARVYRDFVTKVGEE